MGHTPNTTGTFRKNFLKNSERQRKLSQSSSWNSPQECCWEPRNPINSKHLKPPEHFRNSLPLTASRDASFFVFRSSSGEGLPELVMEFPAALRAFLNKLPFMILNPPRANEVLFLQKPALSYNKCAFLEKNPVSGVHRNLGPESLLKPNSIWA